MLDVASSDPAVMGALFGFGSVLAIGGFSLMRKSETGRPDLVKSTTQYGVGLIEATFGISCVLVGLTLLADRLSLI
ncbi:hypothetical protein SEA_RASPUTIA_44 [Microbacterium phage Rasputia]|nr:hypothetical protein SEA_RASPUTIA_44 [Microbacterium phage Rasputia]